MKAKSNTQRNQEANKINMQCGSTVVLSNEISMPPGCRLKFVISVNSLVSSVSNGSGPSLRVRVRVRTDPSPNWRSGSSINQNCRFGYGWIDISLPVWIGCVFSGSSGGSICKYIYCTCLCYLIMVLNQNRLFDIHESQFVCFLGCETDNIWIHIFPLLMSIFDHGGGQ